MLLLSPFRFHLNVINWNQINTRGVSHFLMISSLKAVANHLFVLYNLLFFVWDFIILNRNGLKLTQTVLFPFLCLNWIKWIGTTLDFQYSKSKLNLRSIFFFHFFLFDSGDWIELEQSWTTWLSVFYIETEPTQTATLLLLLFCISLFSFGSLNWIRSKLNHFGSSVFSIEMKLKLAIFFHFFVWF